MLALQTAEEMYKYCADNKLGTGTTKGWAIKHFQLLMDNLKAGEQIYCVFIGLHNYKSMSKHDNNYDYALTNKRIIMAQHKLLGANVQSVNLENINDITLSKTGIAGMGIGTVCIDTLKETFNVGVNVSFASNIYNCVHDALDEIKGTTFGGDVSGAYSLSRINDLHSGIERFFGSKEYMPATKYIDLYLKMFWWLQKNKDCNTSELTDKLYKIATGYVDNNVRSDISRTTIKGLVTRELPIDTRGFY